MSICHRYWIVCYKNEAVLRKSAYHAQDSRILLAVNVNAKKKKHTLIKKRESKEVTNGNMYLRKKRYHTIRKKGGI